MKHLKMTAVLFVLAAVLLGLAGRAPAASPEVTGRADIVQTARNAGSFKTLLAALEAAGLTDALRGDGPFTVFAPSDTAFAALGQDAIAELLKPANRDQLKSILTYHVVPDAVTATQAARTPVADTLEGTSVLLRPKGKTVMVDRATVVQADIRASNGVIHVIDRVLTPTDLLETAQIAGQFDTLLSAARLAGLADALQQPGQERTLLAPTDKAFASLPEGALAELTQPANRERLKAVLSYHVLGRRLLVTEYATETLQGQKVTIKPVGGVTVNGSRVVLADIKTTNGVIQVLDGVLMPDLPAPSPRQQARAVIELAIQRGVPLFNHGSPAACAAIYEVTARSLLAPDAGVLAPAERERLRKGLADARASHSPRRQAWILRHALDEVYASLGESPA